MTSTVKKTLETVKLSEVDEENRKLLVAFLLLMKNVCAENPYCSARAVEQFGLKPDRIRKILALEGIDTDLRAAFVGLAGVLESVLFCFPFLPSSLTRFFVFKVLQEFFLPSPGKIQYIWQKTDLENCGEHRLWPKSDPYRPGIIQVIHEPIDLKKSSPQTPFVPQTPHHAPLLAKIPEGRSASYGNRLEPPSLNLPLPFSPMIHSRSVPRDHALISPRSSAPIASHSISSLNAALLPPSSFSQYHSETGASSSLATPKTTPRGSNLTLLAPKSIGVSGVFRTIIKSIPLSADIVALTHKRLLIESIHYMRSRISSATIDDDSKRAIYEWLFAVPFV